MKDATQPWWANDPELAEVLRRSAEEFAHELDGREPQTCDEPDPVLADVWSGASKRELADARARYDTAVQRARTAGLSWAEIARLLGVSKQLLHRRFADRRKPTAP